MDNKETFQIYLGFQKASTFSNIIIDNFFSLAGVPPLGGFFCKILCIYGSIRTTNVYILAIIGLLTTVLSAFYYLRLLK